MKFQLSLAVILFATVTLGLVVRGQDPVAPAASGASLFSQARQLLEAGMNNPQAMALVMPNDPELSNSLRDSIAKVTDLITSYRENGLTNLPNLPNLPGLQSVMKVPDKLLRAELSMLQDEIRMAQDMMQNPISATMNTPKDIASMLARMAEQLEQ